MNNETTTVASVEEGQVKFNKDTEAIDVKPEAKLIGLTKEQLDRYRNDPFWKPVRFTLFALFWLVWLGMFAGAIVIVLASPKCSVKLEKPWFASAVAYRLVVPRFRDAVGAEGVGDFAGVREKLHQLRRAGVNTVWATPLFRTNKDEFTVDEVEEAVVDERYGTADELRELIRKAHTNDLKFIADLPLTVSPRHALAGRTFSTAGRTARLLDIAQSDVREYLLKAAQQLIDFGVDGIHFAQYGQKYSANNYAEKLENLAGEIRASIVEMDNEHKFLITSEMAIPAQKDRRITFYTRSLPTYMSVCRTKDVLSCFEQSATFGVDELKRNATPTALWQLYDIGQKPLELPVGSPAERAKALTALTAIQLMLPGTVGVFYGEELGLQLALGNGSQTELATMVWDNTARQGFSTVDQIFFPQIPTEQARVVNYETQKDVEHSSLRTFKKLAGFHTTDEVFQDGDFVISRVNGVSTYARTLAGNENAFVLAVNWPMDSHEKSDKIFTVSSRLLKNHTATAAELVLDSVHNPNNPSVLTVDDTKFTLQPFEFVLLRLVVA